MTAGIFNPYIKKKKNFKASTDTDNPLVTELPTQQMPKVTLRTGSFALSIQAREYKEVPDKIGLLIAHLQNSHREHLLRNGISLIPRGETYQSDPEEAILRTSSGILCIYTGEIISSNKKDDTTDKAYQRLSHMLYTLRDSELLRTYGIAVNQVG